MVYADDALRNGMVSRVVPDAELEPSTRDLAMQIAAPAPLAQQIAKEGFHVVRTGTLLPFFDYHRKAQELMFRSEDRRERVRSFAEKREAQFTGR